MGESMRRTRTIRYSLILGGLLCASVSVPRLEAAPLDRADPQSRQAHDPETTASVTEAQRPQAHRPNTTNVECLARTIQATPAALRHARAGAWTRAVGIIGYQCEFRHEAHSAELPRALVAQLQRALDSTAIEGGQPVLRQTAQMASY